MLLLPKMLGLLLLLTRRMKVHPAFLPSRLTPARDSVVQNVYQLCTRYAATHVLSFTLWIGLSEISMSVGIRATRHADKGRK